MITYIRMPGKDTGGAGEGPNEPAAAAESKSPKSNAVVKDEAYYDDPDILPDPIAMVAVTATVGSVITEFPLGGSEKQVILDATNRAAMILESWKLSKYELTVNHTAFDKIRRFADLCRKYLVWTTTGAAGRICSAASPFYRIQEFADKATGSEFLETCVEKFISKEIQKGDASLSALRRELVALDSSFSESVSSPSRVQHT